MKKKFVQRNLLRKPADISPLRINRWEKEYYTLIRHLEDNNLSRIAKPIHKLLKRTIKLNYDYRFRYQKKKVLPIGKSKMGGYPDLPLNFEWPLWKNEPLEYIAQINLKEIAPLKGYQFVKKEGMLFFFYHYKSRAKDYLSKEKDRWRVIYQPSTTDLKRNANLPYKTKHSSHSDKIIFKDQISIPSPSAIENTPTKSELIPFIIDDLKLNDKEIENYKNLYDKYQGDQFFGYPSYEHRNLQLECEIRYNKIPIEKYVWENHSFEDAKSWMLLFEIHDKPSSSFNWGDGIVTTFWIREKDLQKNNFDDVWAHIMFKKY